MFGVALAQVPLLLFTYFGLHTRLLIDDYAYMGLARQIGAWEAMLQWRELLHGDYSNFLLHGLLAPLAEKAPPIFSLIMMTAAFVGFSWLVNKVLSCLEICRHRHKIVVALASLSVAATIIGFYTAQAFYWMSAAVEYTWPSTVLLLGIALAVETGRRLHSKLHHGLAAAAAVFYAFVNAGFSELYLVAQMALAGLAAVYVYAFQHGRKRRTYLILALALCLGTFSGLLAQLSAPGHANKISQPKLYGYLMLPVRDLPALVSGAFSLTLQYSGQQAGFAGFMLVVFAGLFMTLSAASPTARDPIARKISVTAAPTAISLAVQLLFLPILWSHRSDDLQVFGRFSYAYMTVISINLLMILVLLTLLWRRRLNQLLTKRNGLMMYCSCVLLVVCLLFMFTQVRNIHYKASSYLFFTALAMLLMVAGQLTFTASEPRFSKLFQASLFVAACAVLTLSAQLAVMLWGTGIIIERSLAAATFVLMIAGLLIGVSLGALIHRGYELTIAPAARPFWIRLFCLVFAGTIAAGIVFGQAHRIVNLRNFAETWDADYQTIIRLRDEGDPAVYTKFFALGSSKYYRARTPAEHGFSTLGWMQKLFYGLDYEPDSEIDVLPVLE